MAPSSHGHPSNSSSHGWDNSSSLALVQGLLQYPRAQVVGKVLHQLQSWGCLRSRWGRLLQLQEALLAHQQQGWREVFHSSSNHHSLCWGLMMCCGYSRRQSS
jgi:hypothetical protein